MKQSQNRPLYNIIKKILRVFFKLTFRVKIIGIENLKNAEAMLVASNHISLLDPPVIATMMPWETSIIAKSELFKNKIFGGIIKYMKAIPIRRAIFDRTALRIAGELLNDGNAVLIFPEGTRKSSSAKAGISKIVFSTQKNILPIYIRNSDKPFSCMFFMKRLELIVGEPIIVAPFLERGESKDLLRELASYILERINKLNELN